MFNLLVAPLTPLNWRKDGANWRKYCSQRDMRTRGKESTTLFPLRWHTVPTGRTGAKTAQTNDCQALPLVALPALPNRLGSGDLPWHRPLHR